ncbi:MAG: type II secretion system F family protein [Rubrivivax sp.]
MPAYKFEALDEAGKAQSGLLEADNAKAARAQLRSRQLVPLAVNPVGVAANDATGAAPRLSRRVFWRDGAGGVDAPARRARRFGPAARTRAHGARRRVGQPAPARARAAPEETRSTPAAPSRALAGTPREVRYRAVVAAGRSTLGAVLEKLADDLETRQALRAKVTGAMLYPGIVSLVAVLIVIVLMTYVVPQIANVFTSSKRCRR